MSLHKRTGMTLLAALATFVVAITSASAMAPGGRSGDARAQRRGAPPSNQHLDERFSHDRYYYDPGFTVRRPPPGGPGELRGRDGNRYWFQGGNWYRWNGGLWVVSVAPIGILVPVLPPHFTTVWWFGIPYYYANDTYYLWDDDRRAYEVVAPPDAIDSTGSPRQPPSDRLFIYPKNGQSTEQQDRDQYECHRWAVGQSGFDPTLSGGGVAPDQLVAKRNDYFRAQVSCLEGRDYVVK